jgi:hypothetical protein
MMTQNGSVSSILGQDMFSPIKNAQPVGLLLGNEMSPSVSLLDRKSRVDDETLGSVRGPYLIVLSSVCEQLFYHESYCDESVIMTIYGFLNIQICCDVSSGVELCPYMAYGWGLPIYGYLHLSCYYSFSVRNRQVFGIYRILVYLGFGFTVCLNRGPSWS